MLINIRILYKERIIYCTVRVGYVLGTVELAEFSLYFGIFLVMTQRSVVAQKTTT